MQRFRPGAGVRRNTDGDSLHCLPLPCLPETKSVTAPLALFIEMAPFSTAIRQQTRMRKSALTGSPVAQPLGQTMNSLGQALNEYIAIRRALGFKFREVAGCL